MLLPSENLKQNLEENLKRTEKMRSSSKQGGENNRGISGHMYTLHQRLYHALNLGLGSHEDKGRKWHCTDIEIQRLVVRSIDAFLDCTSTETSQHPLVKDSVTDMIGALEGILQFKYEVVLSLASNVVVKMISILPGSIMQSHVLDLVRPLSSLLSSHQVQVAVSCATALNLILSSLSSKREKEVWEILKETHTVVHIVSNIKKYSSQSKPIEYFQEMATLSSKILWRWPASRFCVWNDDKLMEVLEAIGLQPYFPFKVAILQLYSALALCGNGAQKLLENGEVLHMMVHCMGSSNSHSVRIEGFKLAQCLVINGEGCFKMMKMWCEPITKAIICGMSSWSSHSGKVAKEQLSLLMEACRLALITRWAGEHHNYFWELGVDRVLVNLLLNNFHKSKQSNSLSLQEQIHIAQKGLNENFLLVLRPYVWDILGSLAVHCEEDFNPEVYGNEVCVNILMTCACLAFADSIHNTCQICQNDTTNAVLREPASRSVLMMIYSPCKYIASQVRCILAEILRVNGKKYLKHLLDNLNVMSSRSKFGALDNLQTVVTLMSLACYIGLPQYRKYVIRSKGIKTLLDFIRWCLGNRVQVKRLSVAPHLHNTFHEKTCCCAHAEDWEGEDMLLLFGLWGLAELIHHSGCVKSHSDILSSQMEYSEAQLVSELQEICADTLTPGPKWFAAYILSYFGLYGFPNKLGKRIGKALNEKEQANLELILTNGESLSVHGVILMNRCPLLLPPEELPDNGKASDDSLKRQDMENFERSRKEVRLSAHVDRQALSKMLEFIYLGYLHAGVDLVKKLKIFARHCKLQCLLQLLCRKIPKWGTPIPGFDLSFALGPAGHHFSDIILESKATEVMHWACSVCSLLVPHMHVHKVILWSSCDYLQAMFQSGMQESHSQIIKVPVSCEALVKLVNWLYSEELPKPKSGCLWDNLDSEEKLHELQPYVELHWLGDFWLLGELRENCSRVIISCLESDRHLSIKIIQMAADLFQWKLAEVAANYMAPLYHRLRSCGELEALDEELIDMVRAASVRLSQEGGLCPS
ncbi:hypothetical protein F0562_008616 [Nyssa sinensis]|uniref:BTB domain-containing protein n=1 Tax=Nyssa sinensis TaxID=561372 RepID=A0A5J5A7U1_9ASTE|nr:hypothetical protein F0562_008616 [Nyssa sinensis]